MKIQDHGEPSPYDPNKLWKDIEGYGSVGTRGLRAVANGVVDRAERIKHPKSYDITTVAFIAMIIILVAILLMVLGGIIGFVLNKTLTSASAHPISAIVTFVNTTASSALTTTMATTTTTTLVVMEMGIVPSKAITVLQNKVQDLVGKVSVSSSSATTLGSTTTTTRARYGVEYVPICNNKLHPEWVPGKDCKYGEADCIATGDSCGNSHGTWNCEYRY